MRLRSRSTSWLRPVLALVCLLALAAPADAASRQRGRGDDDRRGPRAPREKLDRELKGRSTRLLGTTRVIVTFKDGADLPREIQRLGGRFRRRLGLVSGAAVELPNWVISRLAEHSDVVSIHYDRPTSSSMNRVASAVGARSVAQEFGFKGAGVGVAVIDSGITSAHSDLNYTGSNAAVRRVNGQRVTAYVNFVEGTSAYDQNGHGTHVAGIIAGNGYETYGARAGIAPEAHLVSLKVLDAQGQGVISDVIAALEWVVANRAAHNIRVVNLSVGARVTESYQTDPLTLAAKRAVDAGIVVVAAAGNMGKNANGKSQYGAITAPGNAPWVLTVGASSTEGTVWRWDDKIAPYSSRGPTAIDFLAKPDLVAPGTGVVSLTAANSTFALTKTDYLPNGTRWGTQKKYLSLSGTSMAAPVVAGTVALMVQANPSLTPNLVKAILQYTAEQKHYDPLTQGAGFLNAYGAVKLARFYATARTDDRAPTSWTWSKQILWGNQRLTGGVISPKGNAWGLNIVWGTAAGGAGENIVWGTLCGGDCENIVWGTLADVENIVWGTASAIENIVWGTVRDGENIVWGTLDSSENIVWGTACGSSDCENIVWGTAMNLENIVWGTAMDLENIVWGTAADLENIVWGTSDDVTWASNDEEALLFDDLNAPPVTYDALSEEALFGLLPPPPVTTTVTSTVSGVTGVLGGGQ
jgi:subtilisin family serine protease